MTVVKTPHLRHFRHNKVSKIRRARKLLAWATAQVTRLTSSLTSYTLTPLVAFATGLLTFSANVTGSAKAVGLLTLTGQPLDTETIVIGSKTYTFQSTLTNVDGHVKIGVDAATSISNLIAAITLSVGSGTAYAAVMTANASATASQGAGTTMNVTALNEGAAGNSIATTETLTNGSFDGATLSGGADGDTVTIGSTTYTFQTILTNIANNILVGVDAAASRDNLMNAINGGTGSGSTYAAATSAHPTVTAAASSGNMSVQAKTAGTGGNSIATTKVASNLSWGGATLSGGVTSNNFTATGHAISDGEGPYLITSSGNIPAPFTGSTKLWVHVVDVNTIAFATDRDDAVRGNVNTVTNPGSGTITLSKENDKQAFLRFLRRNKPVQIDNITDIDNLN